MSELFDCIGFRGVEFGIIRLLCKFALSGFSGIALGRVGFGSAFGCRTSGSF